MNIGERGQITIPKHLREKYGLSPHSEVEIVEEQGRLVVRRRQRKRSSLLSQWVGYLKGQPEDVDEFIEDIRGR